MDIDCLIDLLQEAKRQGVTQVLGVTPDFFDQAWRGNAPVVSQWAGYLSGDIKMVKLTRGDHKGAHLLLGDGQCWGILKEFEEVKL